MTQRSGGTRHGDGRTRSLRWIGLAARVAVSGLVVTSIVVFIDVSGTMRLLGAVRAPLLVIAVLSMLATHAANCWRWYWCLLDESEHMGFGAIVVSYWTSLSIGMALPTEYGGDLLRVKDIWDRLGSGSTAVASVFWSRLSGFAAILLVYTLVGLWQLERLAAMSTVWVWTWLSSLAILATLLAVAFIRPISDSVRRLLEGFPAPSRLRNGTVRFLDRTQALATHRTQACRIGVLALATQILMILTSYLLARALDQPVTILDMALVVPLVSLSSALPVSIGGIGVKEGAFVLSLSALGLSQEGALSVALLNRLVLVLAALIGGCLIPFRRRFLKESNSSQYGRRGVGGVNT